MTVRIAFIGFGEAGQTISRGLVAEAKSAIRAYDILFGQPAGAPLEAAAPRSASAPRATTSTGCARRTS